MSFCCTPRAGHNQKVLASGAEHPAAIMSPRIISIHISWTNPYTTPLRVEILKKKKAYDKRFTWTVGRLASPGSSNTCRGHNLRQWPASIWIISPDIPGEIKEDKKKKKRSGKERELVLAIKSQGGGEARMVQ